MQLLRGSLRLILFLFVTGFFINRLIIASYLWGRTYKRSIGHRYQWGITALSLLGVKIELQSEVPPGSHLFMCNHRTYLDGAIMVKYVLGTFVVKKEVSRWPIIGPGAKASMSILVDRKDKESRKDTREQMRKAMDAGISVVIFPEGTTFTGPGVLELRPGTFQVAEDGGFSVVPVAFEYKDPSDAWVGNDNFVRHFIQCFGKRNVYVKVKFGKPITVTNWEVDIETVHDWLEAETLRMRAEFDLAT